MGSHLQALPQGDDPGVRIDVEEGTERGSGRV